ncbi:Crp/Fnr family transcriptional regulator [Actinomadura spongiicola]|uniref:Crp/Fnr family transcriptional regulator n=1 Tax=Actinomadura spongiicola TaxID=2303421 RepID=A0A372G748_9ACTN|nr:Crp/Fnr family transcriptional regulator [Actinomadura spongiicola]RFS80979.1 Crp/Fnr family transcriptional regulator [Actinomadura spongiicola]
MATPLPIQQAPQHDQDFWAMLTSQEKSTLRARTTAAAHPEDAVVLSEGAPVSQVMIIRTGWAVATVVKAGRPVPLRMYRPGGLIGLGGALTRAASNETITAISYDLHLLCLPVDSFTHFLQSARNASGALLRLQQARLEEADRLRTIRDYPTAVQRLAGLLVELCRPENNPIRRHDGLLIAHGAGSSQEKLGSWIGDSRRTVVRALAALRKEGLISSTLPRFITIPDVDRLRRAVEAIDAGSVDDHAMLR